MSSGPAWQVTRADHRLGCISAVGEQDSVIARPEDRILITGAAGFIGSRVLESLLERGLPNLLCFVRPSSELAGDRSHRHVPAPRARIETCKGGQTQEHLH
jgi:hypothetical protein